MNMNRARPPKDCKQLDLWLSGTINDAIRDAKEAGLKPIEAASIVLVLARHTARVAGFTEAQILEWVRR